MAAKTKPTSQRVSGSSADDDDNGTPTIDPDRPLRWAKSANTTSKRHRHWDDSREHTWDDLTKFFLRRCKNLPSDKYRAGGILAGRLGDGPAASPCDPMPCTKPYKHKTSDTVVSRSWVTLDYDAHDPELPKRVDAIGVGAICHWTHKSTLDEQRWRVHLRTDRDMTPDEYAVVAYFATLLINEGGGWDEASWAYQWTMYLPASTVPGDFRMEVIEGAGIPVDEWLETADSLGIVAPVKDRAATRRERKERLRADLSTPATQSQRDAAEAYLEAFLDGISRSQAGNRWHTWWGRNEGAAPKFAASVVFRYVLGGCLDYDDTLDRIDKATAAAGWYVGTALNNMMEVAWEVAEDEADRPDVTSPEEAFGDLPDLADGDDALDDRPDWATDLDEYKDNGGGPAVWYRRIKRDHHVVIGGVLTPVTVIKVPGGGGLFFEHHGHRVELWAERCRHVAEDGAWCPRGVATRSGDPVSVYCPEHAKEAVEATKDDAIAGRLVAGGSFLLDIPEHTPAVWGNGDKVLWAEGESLMLVGPPGVGKTTVAAQVVEGRLFGGSLFGLSVMKTSSKVLYLAMDRPQQIGRALRRTLGHHDREDLDERLVFWKGPPPEDVVHDPKVFLDLARAAGADTVVVDSIKDAAIGLSEDKVGAAFNKARQECLANGVEMLELHHMVKRGSGESSEPTALSDVYGSAWLTAGSGSVLLLWGAAGDESVRLVHLKQPAEVFGPHQVIHDHRLGRSSIDSDETVDLLGLLRKAGGDGLTLAVAGGLYLGKEKINKTEKLKVRRMLEALVRKGLATKSGDESGYTYFAVEVVGGDPAETFADLKIEDDEPSI